MKTSRSLLTFPMHGQMKLLTEGYRTRDGHLIEWFGRLTDTQGPVSVLSRPEPQALRPLTRQIRKKTGAHNTTPVHSYSWRVPDILKRQRWWIQSRSSYKAPESLVGVPAVVWNPIMGISNIWDDLSGSRASIAVDLLDDWTLHYAFQPIRSELEIAYKRIFQRADLVTANAEGTLALAHRFGRDDAILLPNGCDPERFVTDSEATGPISVGYVGKIGKRVDLSLVRATAASLPHVNFVFAGPILDSDYGPALAKIPNVKLLGDVKYADVPKLLQSFDIGWVPHSVGAFEVGGDAIKTYEYRAAHLPVLSTPIAGAGTRDLSSVYVYPAHEHVSWLRETIGSKKRIPREPGVIPVHHTWKNKAEFILDGLNVDHV